MVRFGRFLQKKMMNILRILPPDPANKRAHYCSFLLLITLFYIAVLVGSPFFVTAQRGLSVWGTSVSFQNAKLIQCKNQCRRPGSEVLPRGIVNRKSNLEKRAIQGLEHTEKKQGTSKKSKCLLAIAVGVKQKKVVDQIARKFSSKSFTIMLFHYDGAVDEWGDFPWSGSAIHVSAINQTK